MALAIADMLAGTISAREFWPVSCDRRTGRGGWWKTSLIEALLDFQFEVLTRLE